MSNATAIFQAISKDKGNALHNVLKIVTGGNNGRKAINNEGNRGKTGNLIPVPKTACEQG